MGLRQRLGFGVGLEVRGWGEGVRARGWGEGLG